MTRGEPPASARTLPAGAQGLRSPSLVLALCCAGMVSLSYGAVGTAMCVPEIARELHLDYAQQGLLLSAMMWPFVTAVAVAGLADRVGFRVLFLAGATFQVSGWLLLAEVRTYPQALGAMAYLGVGGAAVDPLLTPLVCAVYPQRRTRMSNLLHGFFCIGIVLTVGLVLALQSLGVHWRWIFRALGLLCVPYGLAATILRLPRQAHQGEQRQSVRGLLTRPVFWLLLFAMALGGASEAGPGAWLPTFIRDLRPSDGAPADSTVAAGLGLGLFGALMAAGRLLASALAQRLGERRLLLSAAVLSTACLLVAALPVSPWVTVGSLALLGFGVACLWPTLLALSGNRFPRAGASMFSVLSAAGGLGCAVSPALIGCIGEWTGRLGPGMAALAVAPALIFVTVGLLRESPAKLGGRAFVHNKHASCIAGAGYVRRSGCETSELTIGDWRLTIGGQDSPAGGCSTGSRRAPLPFRQPPVPSPLRLRPRAALAGWGDSGVGKSVNSTHWCGGPRGR